ncbi:flagellar biosynthetic protein FliO [Pusillimonas sp. TS35]|uniref:flagellar biosynthetic protein FliO n=1 Tax=Paracandidimonas lactea TaxID=2895524 RepID=UPI00136931CB|nr:flagellar biosynthetic protein FliO [Paracandidimonas lactea]MYN11650.1 flagellar biosynthetic protein FliO [Pusillimonas sp. TS35]
MTDISILRLIGSLTLIVALILAVAWACRKTGLLRGAGGEQIRLIASRSLGARQSLAIIEVEQTRLVIGVGPQQLSLLHVLPPRSAPDAAWQSDAGEDAARSYTTAARQPFATARFSAALARALGKQ